MPVWIVTFFLGLIVASLAEYWGHRLMHWWLLKKKHALHHRDGFGQGWLGELWDYLLGTIWLLPLGFLYSWEAGWAWLAAGFAFACWAAYNHQIQHERPEMCFWLVRPVHYLHHQHHMWHSNFGISCDIWDRVFGTYKKVDWNPERTEPFSVWSLFRIKWI